MGDAGNEREVIIGAPAFVAHTPPTTHIAMLDGLWVIRGGNRIRRLLRSLLQPSADKPEVGGEILEPEALERHIWIRRDDVELLGDRALNHSEQLGVERKLKDSAAFGFLRELRVKNLIRPSSESTRGIDPAKNVGSADPTIVSKRRLQDYI